MFGLNTAAIRASPREAAMVGQECSDPPMTLNERVMSYFEQLRVPVFRYLLRKTRDTGQAEDLTQETFLRLYRHLRDERPLENPKAWLFTVAANLAIDSSRNGRNLTDLDEETWQELGDSHSCGKSNPESALLQNERLERLQAAVSSLTPLQRECLHLRAEGLRYREIAELMRISVSTVADAVRRATTKLARQMESEASS